MSTHLQKNVGIRGLAAVLPRTEENRCRFVFSEDKRTDTNSAGGVVVPSHPGRRSQTGRFARLR